MDIGKIFVFSSFILLPVHWQVLGNQGREFLFGLMANHPSTYHAYFVATSDQPANVTVISPHMQVNITYQTTDGFLSVNLSIALQHEEVGQKRDKGIYVTADVDISLYVMYDSWTTTDTCMVLSVPELGRRHLVGMYSSRYPGLDESEILIVARYNNTSINITLRLNGSVLINGVNYSNGYIYSLEMSEFETFLLQATTDLTGTEIQCNKPVAVFSGNKCARGKYGDGVCDIVVEQIPPVYSLGTDFIALSFNLSAFKFRTLIKVVSVDENTDVYVQGVKRFVLNRGGYAEYDYFKPISIRASKPLLMLEMVEMESGGDPFMIVLPSFSQFSTYYIFSLPASASALNSFTTNHIVVTIESAYQYGILLDGINITANYKYNVTGPDGFTNFTVLIYQLSTPGRHNLQHSSSAVQFGAALYGLGFSATYGHPLGIRINKEVGLGSYCSQPDACSDVNAVCTSGKCACSTGYYDSNGVNTLDGTCTAKVGLDSNCPQPDACSDVNAVCTSGKCACSTGYYDSNGVNTLDGTCTAKIGLGSNCYQPDACSTTNAVCNGGTCVCGTGYYDSNGVNTSDGTCTPKIGLGSNCSQPDACSTTNAVCNGATCVCGTGYYDSNGVNTSDGTCTPKIGLGSNCSQPDACSTTNAVCNGATCVCGTGYYDSNGVNTSDGTCTPMSSRGGLCAMYESLVGACPQGYKCTVIEGRPSCGPDDMEEDNEALVIGLSVGIPLGVILIAVVIVLVLKCKNNKIKDLTICGGRWPTRAVLYPIEANRKLSGHSRNTLGFESDENEG